MARKLFAEGDKEIVASDNTLFSLRTLCGKNKTLQS